jgi:hypothetical protein
MIQAIAAGQTDTEPSRAHQQEDAPVGPPHADDRVYYARVYRHHHRDIGTHVAVLDERRLLEEVKTIQVDGFEFDPEAEVEKYTALDPETGDEFVLMRAAFCRTR